MHTDMSSSYKFCFQQGQSFVLGLVFLCFILLLFGCQYQCNQLRGKTHLRNDLLCVAWDVKPYKFTPGIQCEAMGLTSFLFHFLQFGDALLLMSLQNIIVQFSVHFVAS